MKKMLMIALVLFSMNIQAQIWSGDGMVTSVHDGDGTFGVVKLDSSGVLKVRLAYVDCPEVKSAYVTKDQPFGILAGDSVRMAIKGKKVYVQFCGIDRYGRDVCLIKYDHDKNDKTPLIDLSRQIITHGWGWFVPKYSNIKIDKLNKLEGGNDLMLAAKVNHLGLWQVDSVAIKAKEWAVKPTVWRAAHKPRAK
jgi:endonuclease YncB( thermonuclease family)